MNPVYVCAAFSAAAAILSALTLFILNDHKDRLGRIESYLLTNKGGLH